MMAEFRKASNDFRRTLEEEVEAEKARPSEPAAPLRADDSYDAVAHPEPPPVETPSGAGDAPVSAEPPVEGDTPVEGETAVAGPDEPTVPRAEPAAAGRPDGRPVEPR